MLTLCHVFCKELAIMQVRSVSGNLLRNSIDIIPRGLLFLLLPLIAFCWIHSSSARLDGRRRPGDKNRCIAVYSCQQLIITLKKLDLWPLESTVCRLASVTKERSAKLTLHQELTGPCWTHGWLEALTEEFSAPLLQTTPCIHSHTNFEVGQIFIFFSHRLVCASCSKKIFILRSCKKWFIYLFFFLMHITISGYERQVYIKLWSADDYLMYIVNTDDRGLGPWDCFTRQMDGNNLKYASFSFP